MKRALRRAAHVRANLITRLRDMVHIARTGELHPHSPHGEHLREFWLQVGKQAGAGAEQTAQPVRFELITGGVQ